MGHARVTAPVYGGNVCFEDCEHCCVWPGWRPLRWRIAGHGVMILTSGWEKGLPKQAQLGLETGRTPAVARSIESSFVSGRSLDYYV
jgi:hypothetical protein